MEALPDRDSQSAEFLGLLSETGNVRKTNANLVLLDANPLETFEHTQGQGGCLEWAIVDASRLGQSARTNQRFCRGALSNWEMFASSDRETTGSSPNTMATPQTPPEPIFTPAPG